MPEITPSEPKLTYESFNQNPAPSESPAATDLFRPHFFKQLTKPPLRPAYLAPTLLSEFNRFKQG